MTSSSKLENVRRRDFLVKFLALPAAAAVAIPLLTDDVEAQGPEFPGKGRGGKGKAKGKGKGKGKGKDQAKGQGRGQGKAKGKGKGKGRGRGPVDGEPTAPPQQEEE